MTNGFCRDPASSHIRFAIQEPRFSLHLLASAAMNSWSSEMQQGLLWRLSDPGLALAMAEVSSLKRLLRPRLERLSADRYCRQLTADRFEAVQAEPETQRTFKTDRAPVDAAFPR